MLFSSLRARILALVGGGMLAGHAAIALLPPHGWLRVALLAALSVAVAALISCQVAGPLARLRAALRAATDGTAPPALPATGVREIDATSAAFAAVAARLSELTDSVEQVTSSLQQEIAEHTRELVAAKERAEVANHTKSAFLANVSHEMRTPLTAILGYTEILLDEAEAHDAPQRILDAARTVHHNSEHLLQVINDLLDLSRIESGKLEVEQVLCSPRKILADVDGLLRMRAEDKGLALEVRCKGPIPETMRSDPMRIRQILLNLVGNAIKFTDTGSVVVEMSLARGIDGPRIRFDVSDNGIGIDPSAVEKLWKPFSQADGTFARRYGGSGLGLAISRRLAAMIGGDVRLLWSAPGEGSVFRAAFPTGPLEGVPMVHELEPMRAPVRPSRETAAVVVEGPASHIPAPGQLACRILLVEDGPDNRRLLTHVLERTGATVVCAENGRVALDLLFAEDGAPARFDVILMDMQMPVLDGYAATAELRKRGCAIPVIALTAHAMVGDRERCLAAGCTDYASKPFRWSQLMQCIRRGTGAPVTAS
jgi:signal transduction histidine kinase/ActR/RegA family two-component response regulator